MQKPEYIPIFRALVDHRVEFIVVGGVGAVLQGAPVMTFDLDVVHSREPADVRRLLKALESMDAFYRTQPERQIKPQASHLESSRHQLLMTRYGPLDLLSTIGRGHTYEEIHRDALSVQVGEGLSVAVLELSRLIDIKGETADEKDIATLPILRRTLREKR